MSISHERMERRSNVASNYVEVAVGEVVVAVEDVYG
jgi:hypothetical protein